MPATPKKPAIDEKYKKYFKLKKMGMHVDQLKMKMTNEGMDPSVIDQPEPDWDAVSAETPAETPAESPSKQELLAALGNKLKPQTRSPPPPPVPAVPAVPKKPAIDEKYKKYFKLKKMGMNVDQLKMKMTNEGMDPSVIDQPEPDWDAVSAEASEPVPSTVVLSSPSKPAGPAFDEKYKKYFKLKKMGMNVDQLKMKMTNEGMDPSIIDQPEPDWNAVTSETPAETPSKETPSLPNPDCKPSTKPEPEPEPEPEPDPYTPPTRAKYTPSVPLRQVYWSTVNGRDLKDTIWETLPTERVNGKELEELFEVKKQATGGTPAPATNSQPTEEQVSFVDPKKETNIGIGLRKLRYSSKEIRQFLLNIDSFSLSVEALSVMGEIVPKQEECKTIRAYQGPADKLNTVNAFLFAIASIPNCQERVQCLLLRATFHEECARIRQTLCDFQSDCEQVEHNGHFLLLLAYVLEIGNYLNGSSARGGACGFHLEILPQLERTKTSNNDLSFIE